MFPEGMYKLLSCLSILLHKYIRAHNFTPGKQGTQFHSAEQVNKEEDARCDCEVETSRSTVDVPAFTADQNLVQNGL